MRNPASKQTIKQNILATQRFELSTVKFWAECFYWLSYRGVIIFLVLSDYYYSPFSPNLIKILPVVHEKQLSGSQIWISIRFRPNFELGLAMIITSLLTKFHKNRTSNSWEILLTNKQTNKQTDKQKILATQRFELSTLAFLAQCSYRLSYRAVLIW